MRLGIGYGRRDKRLWIKIFNERDQCIGGEPCKFRDLHIAKQRAIEEMRRIESARWFAGLRRIERSYTRHEIRDILGVKS